VAVIDIGGYTTDVLTFNALIGTIHGSVGGALSTSIGCRSHQAPVPA
jgi:hypothetical protein